eukprot:jgi/Mesen1/2693/ME000167S01851
MDFRDREKVSELIDAITSNTGLELDAGKLKALKSFGRQSDDNIRSIFEFLQGKFVKNHAQVRYMALLTADVLFMRSRAFRALLAPSLESFLQLTVGYRTDLPLPPPAARAKLLRKTAIETLERWNDAFGEHYRQVRLGYRYLRHVLHLQFPGLRERAAEEERRRRERQARVQALYRAKYEKLRASYPDARAELLSSLEQMRQCFDILRPTLAGGDAGAAGEAPGGAGAVPEAAAGGGGVCGERDEQLGQHQVSMGAPSSGVGACPSSQDMFGGEGDEEEEEEEEYGLRGLREAERQAEAAEAAGREVAENPAVLESLRELHRPLVLRHLPAVLEWLHVLARAEPPQSERAERDTLLKEVIDLRNEMQRMCARCQDLGLLPPLSEEEGPGGGGSRGEDELDAAMEDVEWESGPLLGESGGVGGGADLAEAWELDVEAGGANVALEDATPADGGGRGREERGQGAAPAGSGGESGPGRSSGQASEADALKQKLMQEAPAVAWGAHLDHWGAEEHVPVNARGLLVDNHWGRVDHDACMPADMVRDMHMQASYYQPLSTHPGQPCGAPLKSGGFCQRRDLRKCPMHGPIVPRDAKGQPVEAQPSSSTRRAAATARGAAPSRPGGSGIVHTEHEKSAVGEARGTGCEGESVEEVLARAAKQAVANVRRRAGEDEEAARRKRQRGGGASRQRAREVREHNDAVLRGSALAGTAQGFEEMLGIDGGEGGEAAAAAGGRRSRRGQQGTSLSAMLKKKPTAKDRVAKKLLNVKVKDATVAQINRDEDRQYREAYPNRW